MMHWGNFYFLKNKLQTFSFKNSFACKKNLGEKRLAILFQSNPFGP